MVHYSRKSQRDIETDYAAIHSIGYLAAWKKVPSGSHVSEETVRRRLVY